MSNNNYSKMVKRLKEMAREERNMAKIMKAFEWLEKRGTRKQESRRKQRPSDKNSRFKADGNSCFVGSLAPGFDFPNTNKDFANSWVKSEGNSPADSVDHKLGESGCAEKRILQQASEQDSIAMSNVDQKSLPFKKRRIAREFRSECPSPTVSSLGHVNVADSGAEWEDNSGRENKFHPGHTTFSSLD